MIAARPVRAAATRTPTHRPGYAKHIVTVIYVVLLFVSLACLYVYTNDLYAGIATKLTKIL